MPDHTLVDCHILVVEDEYMLADEIRDVLEEAGAIVLGPAPDVEGALALLASERRIDGAVLDVNLGGEPSYQVADELLRREVPLLFTTGYDPLGMPERYHEVPRCEKPIRVAAICEAIGRVIHD